MLKLTVRGPVNKNTVIRLYTPHILEGYSLGLFGTEFFAERVLSISTLHAGPDQPYLIDKRHSKCTSNPEPNPNPLRGSRSEGTATRLRRVHFGGSFPLTFRAVERPASAETAGLLKATMCLTVPLIGGF